MATSDLTRMEASGVLRKIKLFTTLDKSTGIIDDESTQINSALRLGLDTFARGGYNDDYGLEIMNRVIGVNGMKAVRVTRILGVASFVIKITSVLDNREVVLKYPHGGYK